MSQRIVYHPPSRQAVDQFARKVCEQLGEQNVTYLSPDVVSGFAQFIEIAATIWTEHLNQESEAEHKLDSKTD